MIPETGNVSTMIRGIIPLTDPERYQLREKKRREEKKFLLTAVSVQNEIKRALGPPKLHDTKGMTATLVTT